MGLFDHISKSVDDISTDYSSDPEPGTYEFQVTDLKVKVMGDETKMPGETAVIFELTVIGPDGDPNVGKSWDDFQRVPDDSLQGDKAEMYASMLKSALLRYGVPESELNNFDPEDPDQRDNIEGVIGKGTLKKNKKGYLNLWDWELEGGESGVSDTVLSPATDGPTLGKW